MARVAMTLMLAVGLIAPAQASPAGASIAHPIQAKDPMAAAWEGYCLIVSSPYEAWLDKNQPSKSIAGKKKRAALVSGLDQAISGLQAGYASQIPAAEAKLDSKHYNFNGADLGAGFIRFRNAIKRMDSIGGWMPSRAMGIDFDYGTDVRRLCSRLDGIAPAGKPTVTEASAKRYVDPQSLVRAYVAAGGVCARAKYSTDGASCYSSSGTYLGGPTIWTGKAYTYREDHTSSGIDIIYGPNWSFYMKGDGNIFGDPRINLPRIANGMGGVLF